MEKLKPNLLLNKDIKEETKATIEHCIELAKARYPEHAEKFVMPRIRWDVKNTCGGLAYVDQKLLRLNLVLYVENREHYKLNVIPHEYAHLVTHWVYGLVRVDPKTGRIIKIRSHGKEWKECAAALGITPTIHHPYDVTSIQAKKRTRKRKLTPQDTLLLVKRIQGAVKRLDKFSQHGLALWLEDHLSKMEEAVTS